MELLLQVCQPLGRQHQANANPTTSSSKHSHRHRANAYPASRGRLRHGPPRDGRRGTWHGGSRRARGAAKRGAAFFIAQGIALLVYSVVIAVLLVLMRVQYDFSVDGVIDGFLDVVTPGDG